jgi:flagellar protein FliO/FliZ
MASGFDFVRLIGSFLLVLGLLALVLWGLRRVQSRGGFAGVAKRQMQVVESLSLGPRQKIVLVRVGTRELVLGVTPTSISALDHQTASAATLAAVPTMASFAANLQMATDGFRQPQEPNHGV